MERTPVVSTAIEAVGYEPESETLEVEFTSGGVYQYEGVPGQVFDDFMNSDSFGSYFQQNIRGHYQEQKVG